MTSTTQSKVLVRAEGGLGDCLLSNRFIPAIREYHSDCHITFAFDNHRGETYQLDVLKKFYASIADRYCFWHEIVKSDYDLFYDLHIDKMEWTTYDFDWLSRFYYFPKPEVKLAKKDHVCLHLTHASHDPVKHLRKDYITRVVDSLYEVEKNLLVICTNEEIDCYENVSSKVDVFCGSIVDVCEKVLTAKAFVTIDSGFKYMAYANGVPTIETANYYYQVGVTHPMIKARWLPFQERGLPLYSDPQYFAIGLRNILENGISSIFPYNNSNNKTFKL
jgi:ADP-heptose:LPS heptosyltransferase